MKTNVPVFTTSTPSFMGTRGDTNEKFIEDNTGKRVCFHKPGAKKWFSLYIDGQLEEELGYDIPIFLKGEIVNVPVQRCEVWDVAGKTPYAAFIVLGEFKYCFYGLIVMPDELIEAQQYMMSEHAKEDRAYA